MFTRLDTTYFFLDYLSSAFSTAAKTSNLAKANFHTALSYIPVFILTALKVPFSKNADPPWVYLHAIFAEWLFLEKNIVHL